MVRRRLLSDPLAAGLIALAVFAFFGRAFLNYDTFYSLLWGGDLANGRTPDYKVPFAPTPHPLAMLVGIPASLFGNAGEGVMLAIVILGIGALVLGIFRLGEQLFSWQVGLLAALIVATRQPFLNYGIRGYVDLVEIALVVWAAVLEAPASAARLAGARAARAGRAAAAGSLALRGRVLALAVPLARLAGPDKAGGAGGGRAARAGASATWRSPATSSGRCTERTTWPPSWSGRPGSSTWSRPRRGGSGRSCACPSSLAAVVGFVFSLLWLRRRAALPAAVVVLNGLAFCAFGIAGLSLLGRYLFLAGAMLALFTAVACLGWMELPEGAAGRSLWRVVGLVALAGIVVFFPAQQVHRLTALRTDIRNRDRVQSDLRKVAQTTQAKSVLRACRSVFVPNHRPVPLLAYWADIRPQSIATRQPARGIAAAWSCCPPTPRCRSCRSSIPHEPIPLDLRAPAGYRVVSRNRSWLLYAGPTCRPA